MPLLRLVIACLVMAALPLQGIAAASMLFCDQAAHSLAQQQAAHGDHAGHATAHDHHAHGHGGHPVDSGRNDHQATVDPSGQQGFDLAQADHQAGVEVPSAGDAHACPICASCCNLVALFAAPTRSLDSARPVPPPLPGRSRVLTREAPAPDKPPRA